MRCTLAGKRKQSSEFAGFTLAIHTRGAYQCSFVFRNEHEVTQWKKSILRDLEKEYGKLRLEREALPGLQVGDRCQVWGEGLRFFRIQQLIKFAEFRYGFVLDRGDVENVAKCHNRPASDSELRREEK